MAKLKHFYPNEADIPADLKGAYESKNGRWELIELGDDVPLIQTKKSLEETQATLKEDLRKANEKVTRLEARALPDGKIAVDLEIEALGSAAKAAGVKADEIPNLKTKADDLQKQIDKDAEKKIREKAAAAIGKRFENFDEHATANGLKIVEKTEKVNDKDTTFYAVVGKDAEGKDKETRLTDYVKEKAAHLPEQTENKTVRRFGAQLPDNKKPAANKFDAIREAKQAEQNQAQNSFNGGTVADKFYGRVSRQPVSTQSE